MNIMNLFKRKPKVQLNSGADLLKMYLTEGRTEFYLPSKLSPEARAVIQFISNATMNQNFVRGFDRFQVIRNKKHNLVYNLMVDVVTGKQSLMDINLGCVKQTNERDRQAYREAYELCITLVVTSTDQFNDIYFPDATAEVLS